MNWSERDFEEAMGGAGWDDIQGVYGRDYGDINEGDEDHEESARRHAPDRG